MTPIDSTCENVDEVIIELRNTKVAAERAGQHQDQKGMEQLRKDGYMNMTVATQP